MRKLFFFMALFATLATYADDKTVSSPDGRLQVTISCQDGCACYSVSYDGTVVLKPSALGLVTNLGDFTQGLTMQEKATQMPINKHYKMRSTKRSDISYQANRLQVDFATAKRIPMSVKPSATSLVAARATTPSAPSCSVRPQPSTSSTAQRPSFLRRLLQ